VHVHPNENHDYRGLHVVVFNPKSGSVETAKAFDTYKSSAALENFIGQHIPEGFIIAAACMDDCVSNLSKNAKQWFANMGSKEIWNVGYRQGFTFIGVAGRKDF